MDLRYPIGEWKPPGKVGRPEREAWIAELEKLPANLREAVRGLNDAQLDTPYRPGGWTVRQVAHHIADGHMSAYTRFRLALTEQTPTIKPFDEQAWAELVDAKSGPVEPSLALTEGLHRRWVMLLGSLADEDFQRRFQHPERSGPTPLVATLSYFAWHSRHHVAQIVELRKREGW